MPGRVVRVRLDASDGAVRLEVADDGPGVPTAGPGAHLRRFVALHEARTRGSGSGLGLAIARQIATRHGGTLRVCDGDLGGAEFQLLLAARSGGQEPSTSRSIDSTTSATASRAGRR